MPRQLSGVVVLTGTDYIPSVFRSDKAVVVRTMCFQVEMLAGIAVRHSQASEHAPYPAFIINVTSIPDILQKHISGLPSTVACTAKCGERSVEGCKKTFLFSKVMFSVS